MSNPNRDVRYVQDFKLYPVDQIARRVTQPGVTYEIQGALPNRLGGVTWDAPPQMIRVPHGVRDLTGTRRGRMEIVGYLLERTDRTNDPNRRHIWVARCDCGRYEPRIAKTWHRGLRHGKTDLCAHCLKWGQIRDSANRGPVPDRVGRLSVVARVENGLYRVRCDCGNEEYRKERSLRRVKNSHNAMCEACWSHHNPERPS